MGRAILEVDGFVPVCPHCDVAYLDGESHRCGGKTRRPRSVVWVTLRGAAFGAVGGLLVMTIFCDVVDGARNIWCVLFGAVIGVPLGAAVGALVGGREGKSR